MCTTPSGLLTCAVLNGRRCPSGYGFCVLHCMRPSHAVLAAAVVGKLPCLLVPQVAVCAMLKPLEGLRSGCTRTVGRPTAAGVAPALLADSEAGHPFNRC